ncbi:MAG: hypothetical protein EYC70_06735 [Planctomycetota bacterium]|nr:MAG: hypothetical protein EYC70_06735 [Planctomycetota bacterium]
MSPLAPLPRLRRFEILEELGRGNTGVTYRARARVDVGGLRAGDVAALKILHPQLSMHQQARKAFLREARVGMQVRHPNLVRVYAVEEVQRRDGRLLYLVLEFLEGQTVRERLDTHVLPSEPALRSFGRQLAGALSALHQAGLLHLDVKPENLMVQRDRIVLMDLGFARPQTGERPARPAAAAAAGAGVVSSTHLSSDFLFAGTPAYAAPELLHGGRPTAAADLFALGVCLYEWATGMRPFGDETERGLFEARRSALVRKPSTIQPRLSPFLDQLVLTLIDDDPARRFASAAELEQVLAEGENSAWWQRHGGADPLLPLVHPDALPFQDREPEFAHLEQEFARARETRRPRVVVLTGAAAVGKSRLVLELGQRSRARPEAPPFLYGRCLRLGRGSALRAVRDALSRSLGLAPDQPPTESVERRLRSALPPGTADVLLGLLRGQLFPREQRRRAYKEWFRALGREGPFLCLFDDLQSTTANMWQFMAQVLELEDVPALFLLGHRPELTEDAALARRALLRSPQASELLVEPLTETEMVALVQRVFAPGKLPASLQRDLVAASAGLPGVLHDLLRYLHQRGDLQGKRGALQPAHERVEVPLTRDHFQILRSELQERPEEQRELLRWASVFAPPLRLELLAEVAGMSEAHVADLFGALEAEGWLKLNASQYSFALQRLREAAYRSMDAEEQRRRHARLYELFTRSPAPIPQRDSARAFHAHRAGLHAEALALGIPLLERHLLQSATDRAILAAQRLLEHADAIGWDKLSLPARCRLLVARARVEGLQGRHEPEAELLAQAGRLANEADDDALRARVHLGLSRHAHDMGFAGAARLHLQRARELRSDLRNPARIVDV